MDVLNGEERFRVMSEFKFACPHCGQHFKCDQPMSGREIQSVNCHLMLHISRVPGQHRTIPPGIGQDVGHLHFRCVPPSKALYLHRNEPPRNGPVGELNLLRHHFSEGNCVPMSHECLRGNMNARGCTRLNLDLQPARLAATTVVGYIVSSCGIAAPKLAAICACSGCSWIGFDLLVLRLPT